jgi:hypothetical protein
VFIFEVFFFSFFLILSGGCTLALFYLNKSVSILISVQQHSLCSSECCLSVF